MKKYNVKKIILFVIVIIVSVGVGFIIQYRETQYRSFFVQKTSLGQENDDAVTAETSAEPENKIININTDSVEELEKLDGIGEKTAERIINYRRQNGDFEVIEDIMRVNGIGKKKFEAIKDFICVE